MEENKKEIKDEVQEEIVIEEMTQGQDKPFATEQIDDLLDAVSKMRKRVKRLNYFVTAGIVFAILFALFIIIKIAGKAFVSVFDNSRIEKPVIYVHNDLNVGDEQVVDISLKDKWGIGLKTTYPSPVQTDDIYKWTVTLKGGTDNLYINDKEYPYLFWDTENFTADMGITEGFCIKGTDTEQFLEEKLRVLGLTDIEITDFITYWLPEMQKNPYNLIFFTGMNKTDDYNTEFPLTISNDYPIYRVLMIYKSSDTYIDIPEQILPIFIKPSAYVLEWGGMELK